VSIIPFKREVRLHGKTPHVRTTSPSYPILLRDQILQRVKVMSFFAGFNFTSNKALQITINNIPFCGVYLIQETMAPDGEPNTGEIRFRTMARIGFSVIIVNNDSDAAEVTLDKAMQALTNGLFRDQTFYNNSIVKFQGVTSGMRQHVFGAVPGQDNETPIAELRLELTFDLGVIDYPPFTEDDLEVIHIQTNFPIHGDASQVQQVVRQYDMEQTNDDEPN